MTSGSNRGVPAAIVIPVLNDPEGISQTLRSVTNQSIEVHEIIVVDNGSSDNTRDVVQGLSNTYENITLLVEDEVQSSYAARNRGIGYASSDILVFLDADETVGKDWLETAISRMDDQKVKYLGCNVELTLSEDTLVGRYNARTGFPVAQYLETEKYAPTCALLVHREVFDDIGTFDSRLISGGDVEFGQRVAAADYEQGFAEEAIVTHPARTSFKSLAKKNFRVGQGFCQKQRYYPERYGRPGIPPKPTGVGSGDETEPQSLLTQLAFRVLSLSMLVCRGLGYYYEFLIGEDRATTR